MGRATASSGLRIPTTAVYSAISSGERRVIFSATAGCSLPRSRSGVWCSRGQLSGVSWGVSLTGP